MRVIIGSGILFLACVAWALQPGGADSQSGDLPYKAFAPGLSANPAPTITPTPPATLRPTSTPTPTPAIAPDTCAAELLYLVAVAAGYQESLDTLEVLSDLFDSPSFGTPAWTALFVALTDNFIEVAEEVVALQPPTPAYETYDHHLGLEFEAYIRAMELLQRGILDSDLVALEDAYGWLDTAAAHQSAAVPPDADCSVSASPTPVATATPPAPASLICNASASVNNTAPARQSNVTVTGRLQCSSGNPAGATMHTTWHYLTVTSECAGVTGNNGIATCTRGIGNATLGRFVRIDVTFRKDGQMWSTSTGFTPR